MLFILAKKLPDKYSGNLCFQLSYCGDTNIFGKWGAFEVATFMHGGQLFLINQRIQKECRPRWWGPVGNQAFSLGVGAPPPRGAAFAVIRCCCNCVDLLNLWLFKSLLLIDSISIALWFSCFICFRETPSVLYAGMTSEVTCADVKMARVEATTSTSWHWLDWNLKILWWIQTMENITIELQTFC